MDIYFLMVRQKVMQMRNFAREYFPKTTQLFTILTKKYKTQNVIHVQRSLMSYSLLWFVKINTELLRGVFTTQRFDTPV